MARPCTVCNHASRADIDKALVEGLALRAIAERFGVGKDALQNHKRQHLGRMLAKTARQVEAAVGREATAQGLDAIDVYAELCRCFERVNKLFDACDEFLTDPTRPGRYTLNPRAHEVEVVYLEPVGERSDGTEILATRQAPLDELLRRVQAAGLEPQALRWSVTDPRKLVLEAVGRLERLQQWLTILVKQAGDGARPPEIDEEQIAKSPAWLALQHRISEALRKHPEALRSVLAALSEEAPMVPAAVSARAAGGG